MNIVVYNQQEDLSIDEDSVAPVVRTILEWEGQRTDEVGVYFVNKEEISLLHDQFFQDPSPTDCISFPMDNEEGEYHILGEVFLCPQVAIEYVNKEATHGPYEEVTLYLIHSMLHLLGYQDGEEEERKKMHNKQEQYLCALLEKKIFLSSKK